MDEVAMEDSNLAHDGLREPMMEDEIRRRILRKEEKILFNILKDELERTDFRNLAESMDNEGRKILNEFLKDHILYGPEEEWVSRMTPEQRKEYELSLAQKHMMDMVSPMIGLKEFEKLHDDEK